MFRNSGERTCSTIAEAVNVTQVAVLRPVAMRRLCKRWQPLRQVTGVQLGIPIMRSYPEPRCSGVHGSCSYGEGWPAGVPTFNEKLLPIC